MKVLGIPIFPSSTVGSKVLTALSGLFIFGFLTFHLTANLQLYQGREAFNGFVEKLDTWGYLVYVGEAGLAAVFIYHIIMGIKVTLRNRAAKGQGYAVKQRLGKGTLASLTMPISGLIIFFFLGIHIYTFRIGKTLQHLHHQPLDLYGLVTDAFAKPWYAAFYVIAMLCMGMHLAHAGQSALRTLGLSQVKYLGLARRLSIIAAAVYVIGFCSFPIYFQINKDKVEHTATYAGVKATNEILDQVKTDVIPGPAAGTTHE